MPLRLVGTGSDARGHAFLVIDPAQRLGGVGVAHADLGRAQLLRAGDVLCARQLLQSEKRRCRPENVELARRIIDQRLGVIDDERIALAAAQDRAGEVVHVGQIMPVCELPAGRLIFEIEVEPLTAVNLVERRHREACAQLAELQRIGEVQIVTERRRPVVTRNDRIMRIEPHALERFISAARGDKRVERYLGG